MLLDVPYQVQMVDGACGAAALGMTCSYYGIEPPAQTALLQQLRRPQLRQQGASGIGFGDLVAAARLRGLWIDWLRLAGTEPLDADIALGLVRRCVETDRCPIIICQRYTAAWPRVAHYRIVVGIDRKRVFLHDPCPHTGGAFQPRRFADFIEDWKPVDGSFITGEAVVVRGPVAGHLFRDRIDHVPWPTYVGCSGTAP
jgi:hypothetical protein